MTQLILAFRLVIVLALLVSCSSSSPSKDSSASSTGTRVEVQEPTIPIAEAPPALGPADENDQHGLSRPAGIHWSYSGVGGPDNWGDIREDFQTCRTGQTQSPINLVWHKPQSSKPLLFDYKDGLTKIVDNGHTLVIYFSPGSTIDIHGDTYRLQQGHFHSPSEHTISARSYPLEFHFVHKNEVDGLAVVAVMVKSGPLNRQLQKILDALPTTKKMNESTGVSNDKNTGLTKNAKNVTTQTESKDGVDLKAGDLKAGDPKAGPNINPQELLPKQLTHYHYSGSLTTPPCTEGVNWNVLNTPIVASEEQIAAFRSLYSGNSRPLQPMNGRLVVNH